MIDQRFAEFQAQIDRRFNGVHESIEANTVLTQQADDRSRRIEENTRALIEIFDRAGKSATFFARTARFVRSAAIWLGPFITVGGVIWAIAHGKWPTLD
ncbi:hypothetical protein SAMN05446927_5411 [Caballeronia arationis]|uniref:Uncharacterized protein n=1 Tax=Caballeronia arationis TaxID=1777142 RepID=A0A7Z7IBG1_9BURK|nr:hypothetical protein [Caballeronia arationis]SOE82100.1 hypothetical protein SAMN05446927_5411 [Caballeronia arationis]